MGRPTKYLPEHAARAAELTDGGATNREVARALGISESTLHLWRAEHPEFSDALKMGKEAADERVISSLYRRAVGYSFDAVKIFMPAGAPKPIHTDYVEHVPPDVTAAIFWLKNRRREEWRDVKANEHSGPNGEAIQTASKLLPADVVEKVEREADKAY